jgi:hypothetical protein
MQVEEGTAWSQPIPGVKELNDAQKDFLYGERGAQSLTEDPPNPQRVYTATAGREKQPAPAVALHQQDPDTPRGGAVEGTVDACMNSCAGAVYDFWHWNDLKGNASQKFKTVVSRGGRGPYLALSIVGFVVLAFLFFVTVRGLASPRKRPPAPTPATNTVIGPAISAPAAPTKAAFQSYHFA